MRDGGGFLGSCIGIERRGSFGEMRRRLRSVGQCVGHGSRGHSEHNAHYRSAAGAHTMSRFCGRGDTEIKAGPVQRL